MALYCACGLAWAYPIPVGKPTLTPFLLNQFSCQPAMFSRANSATTLLLPFQVVVCRHFLCEHVLCHEKGAGPRHT